MAKPTIKVLSATDGPPLPWEPCALHSFIADPVLSIARLGEGKPLVLDVPHGEPVDLLTYADALHRANEAGHDVVLLVDHS